MSKPLIDLGFDDNNQSTSNQCNTLKDQSNWCFSNDPFDLAVNNTAQINHKISPSNINTNNVPIGDLISLDSEFYHLQNDKIEHQLINSNPTISTKSSNRGKAMHDATFDDLNNTMPNWIESDGDSDNEKSLPLVLVSPPPPSPSCQPNETTISSRTIPKSITFENSSYTKKSDLQTITINKHQQNEIIGEKILSISSPPTQLTECKISPPRNKLADNCADSKKQPLENLENLFQSVKLAVEECDTNVDRDKAFILLDKLQTVLIGANESTDTTIADDTTVSTIRRQGTFNLDEIDKDENNVPDVYLLSNSNANNINEGTSSNLEKIIAKLEVLVENNIKSSNNENQQPSTYIVVMNTPPPPPPSQLKENQSPSTNIIQSNINESRPLRRYSIGSETNIATNRQPRPTNLYVTQNQKTHQKSLIPSTQQICQKNIKLRCGNVTSITKSQILKSGKQSHPPLRATVAMATLKSTKTKSLIRSPLKTNQKSTDNKLTIDTSMVNKVKFSPNNRQFATPNPKRISSAATENFYKRRRSLSEVHTSAYGTNSPMTPISSKSKK